MHSDLSDVLSVLDKNGDEILSQISLQTYNCLNENDQPEVFYSCYEGIDFLGSLFGLREKFGLYEQLEHLAECKAEFEKEPEESNLTEGEIDKLLSEMRSEAKCTSSLLGKEGIPDLELNPGGIYFCQLNSKKSDGNYDTSQVHYFLFIYDHEPTLIQAFGGVKGFTVKRVRHNINDLIDEILNLNHEVYRNLFEVPDRFEHLLHFDKASFRAIGIPLVYPTLAKLDTLLKLIGLNFASEKMKFTI